VIQAVVSKEEMSRLLPDDSPKTISFACGLGAASSSCSYAAVALARSMFRKGGRWHCRARNRNHPESDSRMVNVHHVCRCILLAVPWKRILGFVVIAFILVMVGALIYKCFDVHDTRPFGIDPEFLLMMLSSMLIFCVGFPSLICNLFRFCFLAEVLPLGALVLSCRSAFRFDAFEIEHLLFSTPPGVISLRI